MKEKVMVDLFKMSETERIEWIAGYLNEHGTCKFMVDMPTVPEGRGDGKTTKEDRYLRKLRRLATFEVVQRHENTPVPNVVTIELKKLTE